MIHVWPQEPTESDGWCKYSAIIEAKGDRRELWFRVPAEWGPALCPHADPLLVATVFQGMLDGDTLHIHGSVSPSLLRRMEEFQAIWSCWRPDQFKFARLIADREEEAPEAETDNALLSYSGGMDSSFTAYRHLNRKCGRRNQTIGAALMIHGFDIPVGNEAAYRNALEAGIRILKGTGIPIIKLQTNWRSFDTVWKYSHGAAMATCLLLFSRRFNSALLASSDCHDVLARALPWGSNPLTDPLLAHANFVLINDGGEFNRTEKARTLRDWPEALENLRVCWEEPMTGRNCCVCEKCVRTILNFRIVGQGLPACFEKDVSDEDITRIRIIDPGQLLELTEVLGEARKEGLENESWARNLEKVVQRYNRPNAKPSFQKRVVRKFKNAGRRVLSTHS